FPSGPTTLPMPNQWAPGTNTTTSSASTIAIANPIANPIAGREPIQGSPTGETPLPTFPKAPAALGSMPPFPANGSMSSFPANPSHSPFQVATSSSSTHIVGYVSPAGMSGPHDIGLAPPQPRRREKTMLFAIGGA